MPARVVVVGLGPAGPELVGAAARDALERIPVRYARTARHPAAAIATWTATFDDVYEAASSLDDVYATIAARLIDAAIREGEVVYAVPGSPMVAERSVELVREQAPDDVEIDLVPALSFLDLAWHRLGVDPIAAGVRIVDGHRFAVEAAGERGPLLVAQCDSVAVLSEIKLAFGDAPPERVVVLQRLGLPDEAVIEVTGVDLDRSFPPDHLTSIWLPELAAPVGAELVRFAALVRTLREQCPWDREQTHLSLTRHLLEECYEVLEAIAALDEPEPGAGYAHLEEELGDLLFQVVFHATLGAEAGEFTLADVARGIHDKLVRRHPHVFGDVEADTPDQVITNWEQIKKAEKGRDSVFDGIPGELPALLYAHKVLRKAESIGVSYGDAPTGDLDVGERLLGLVAEARRTGIDPETALRAAAARFRDHARAAESAAENVDLR